MLAENDFVVVAGIPGAGKTTMLRRADNRARAAIVDSDQVRNGAQGLVPDWLPYRWYRPIVHLVHRLRIVLVALRFHGPVVVHEPATRASTRLLLIVIGMLARRTRRLIWISAEPDDARRGQIERGRLVAARSFARHVCRAQSVEHTLKADRGLRGWRSTRLVSRPAREARVVLLPGEVSPRALGNQGE